MPALRHTGSSTNGSAAVIEHLLSDPNTTKVVFFATDRQPSGAFDTKLDGPESNLPLVSALAEYTIPGFGPVQLVFDGLFLTRARTPRIPEVDQVLAAACASGKAHYSPQVAPFTSSLTPTDAAQTLGSLISVPMDRNSLPAYLRHF